MNHTRSKIAILALLTLAAYFPVFHAGFIWDDFTYVIHNEIMQATDGLSRIWIRGETVDFWPLSYSFFWWQRKLWGENPLGYHLVNLLLHFGNSVIFFYILRELKIEWAWLTAVIFAIHPVGVGAVAWIFQTKTTLAAFFGLLSILTYLRFRHQRRFVYWIFSLIAFCASLLAKTSLVGLPVVLLLLDGYQSARSSPNLTSWKMRIWPLIPFFLASLVIGWIAVSWYQSDPLAPTFNGLQKSSSAVLLIAFYLSKVLAPMNLCFVYPDWRPGLPDWSRYIALVVAVMTVPIAWHFRRHRSIVLVTLSASIYIVLLFPVLGFYEIYFLKYAPAADQWQYPAYASVLALLVPATANALAHFHKLRVFVFLAVTITLMTLTFKNSQIYRNEESVWRDTLSKNPLSSLAHNQLGIWLGAEGKIEEAKEHYQTILAYDPNDLDANVNMGDYYIKNSQMPEAIKYLQRAIEIDPSSVAANLNLGVVYAKLGKFEEAVTWNQRAIHLNPRLMSAYQGLGNAWLDLKRPAQARAVFERALQIDSGHGEIHFNLGIVYEKLGEHRLALTQFREAERLIPHNLTVRAKMISLQNK